MNFTYHYPQLKQSYALRRVPKEISDINGRRANHFIALRITHNEDGTFTEEPLGSAAPRPMALGTLMDAVENDDWGSLEEGRRKTPEELAALNPSANDNAEQSEAHSEAQTRPETPKSKAKTKSKEV